MEFENFLREYKSLGKSRSSKFSEEKFALFIKRLIGNKGKIKQSYRVELKLNPHKEPIEKIFDIAVEIEKTTLIEVKKNIDNVEKDLLKFVLLDQLNHSYKKVELIWEEENRKGKYADILDFAKSKKWIDKWFYIYDNVSFKNEMARLKEFLLH